ncbi:hypothetical protein WJ75_28545 [Burkholderia ubonensis]|nr:hypothetical protein WJ75_28545 [Burkholderia ubonensis]
MSAPIAAIVSGVSVSRWIAMLEHQLLPERADRADRRVRAQQHLRDEAVALRFDEEIVEQDMEELAETTQRRFEVARTKQAAHARFERY